MSEGWISIELPVPPEHETDPVGWRSAIEDRVFDALGPAARRHGAGTLLGPDGPVVDFSFGAPDLRAAFALAVGVLEREPDLAPGSSAMLHPSISADPEFVPLVPRR